jgi:hypothetical protein
MAGKFCSGLVVLVAAGLMHSPAVAQEGAVAPTDAARPLPEAVVEGRSLRELRRDLRKAEERYHALYNKLNPDREQRIACEDSASTGTRLAKRSCSTEGARAVAARDAMDYQSAMDQSAGLAAQSGSSSAAEAGPMGSVAEAAAPGFAPTDTDYAVGRRGDEVDAQREAYRRNLEKLLAEHPDLRQALDEYNAAYQRHEAARKRK